MAGCNARILSYIVAVVHILVAILVIVGFILYTKSIKEGDDKEAKSPRGLKRILFKYWFFLPLLVLFKTGVLIKGIIENKAKYIVSFLGVMSLVMVVFFIFAVVDFIKELIDGATFGSVIVGLLIDCAGIFVEVVILIPIMVLYNEMTTAPTESQSRRTSSNDENYNKPSYVPAEGV